MYWYKKDNEKSGKSDLEWLMQPAGSEYLMWALVFMKLNRLVNGKLIFLLRDRLRHVKEQAAQHNTLSIEAKERSQDERWHDC